jgi:threonylcarbamoyladenosine tRNA methylthiotransferase MtaB
MPRPSFHTITLGCKLNQFDGAAIEGELRRRGFDPAPGAADADVVIVNTCTVTHRADADARKRIRAVRRSNPDCKLLVTGCYAELEPDRVLALGGVDRVFGNRDKPRLPAILDEMAIGRSPAAEQRPGAVDDRGCDGMLDLPRALYYGRRSRAFLKVQDGCRLACSYCIIPTVRGPSRSVPAETVVDAARSLTGRGFREIVLTGVNTGDWGRDFDPPSCLAGLLRRLLAEIGPNRIRLNSLEPLTLTDEIVELMAADARLAPHVQVPLQSGSAAILGRMRRNYRPDRYLERLERLRDEVPHAGLGADVIVGFPGESDADFDETLRFVEDSPLSYLHVFSWSPRPGTAASDLAGRVPPRIIRRRSERLRALGAELSLRFRRRFEGKRLDAVTLGAPDADGRQRALSGNYVQLTLSGGETLPGAPVAVEVLQATSGETRGVVRGEPTWAAGAGLTRTS